MDYNKEAYDELLDVGTKDNLVLHIFDNMGQVEEIVIGLREINRYIHRLNDKVNKDKSKEYRRVRDNKERS